MSIELNKLAAEFNRYFTSSNGIDVPAKVSVSRDEWRALFTAIQQAAQAAVPMTDAALTERARIVDLIEGRACLTSTPRRLTLELNQLAEVIKSGLGWLEYERNKHHGITAQAKKGDE